MAKLKCLLLLFTFYYSNQHAYGLKSKDICNTSVCQRTGKLIRASINPKIDPCYDFYEFACGGWLASHTIPTDKFSYERVTELKESLQNVMKIEMNETSDSCDSDSVCYLLDFYTACTDTATLESRGVQPVKDVLKRFNGWPLMGKSSHFEENEYEWKESFVKLYANTGLQALIQIEIHPDAKETHINRIHFSVPKPDLSRSQLFNLSASNELVNAYKAFIIQTAFLLGANVDQHMHKDIRELLAFQTELAKITTKPEDMDEPNEWYNRMTFEEFNRLTDNQTDWLRIVQNVYSEMNLNIKLKSSENIIIEDIRYYKGLAELLLSTPNRVIANHFGWLAAKQLIPYTTDTFRQLEFNFNRVKSKAQSSTPLWKYCIDALETNLPFAYSRRYIDNHFTKTVRKEAQRIYKFVKKSVRIALQKNDWLEDVIKDMSIEKLNASIGNIGYPDWLLDDDKLDTFYNLTETVDKRKAFESLLYLQTRSAYNMLKQLRKPVNINLNWPTHPAKVNSFYNPKQNTINIPAGVLAPPFFTSQAPAYLNFGAIGHAIAHEFTHGFDDQGSEYDKNGNLISWWDDNMKDVFRQKSKCFKNKFSKQLVPEVNLKLNAEKTIGEDIADAGGLRQSFNAYKLYSKKYGIPKRLPYVSQYSPEQLFFISNANSVCELIKPEALKQQIENGFHTPSKYRVNLQLTKSEIFSKVFKCKPKSKMNSGVACKLW